MARAATQRVLARFRSVTLGGVLSSANQNRESSHGLPALRVLPVTLVAGKDDPAAVGGEDGASDPISSAPEPDDFARPIASGRLDLSPQRL